MTDQHARQPVYQDCPCCDAPAVPNTTWATAADVSEDVYEGDPLWEEGESRCPACQCPLATRVGDERAYTVSQCEEDDAVWERCPCSRCRGLWMEQHGPR